METKEPIHLEGANKALAEAILFGGVGCRVFLRDAVIVSSAQWAAP